MPSNHAGEDYLTVPQATFPSFHFRVGRCPVLPEVVAPKAPANQWGYPRPGPQSPTPAFATAQHYFVDDSTWDDILDHGEFDDIVVGSGFCALAYVKAALEKDPMRKILMLERGGFWLPEHFQNLPLPFKLVLGGPSETFPWQLSSNTVNSQLKFMHGSCPFFGGRSTFWSAWSPRATGLMRHFPQSMIETTERPGFWERCEDLLHVTPADKIEADSPIFGKILQHEILRRLKEALRSGKLPKSVTKAFHAPLAVGRTTALRGRIAFDKFSTPGPLLEVYEQQRHRAKQTPPTGHPLMIATDVAVHAFETDPEDPDNRPAVLHTSRGALCFPKLKTNVILATGVFPATTILMNSIPKELEGRAGTRVGGHFLTHIAARFPLPKPLHGMKYENHLEIGAQYISGEDPETRLQFHIQVTAIHSPNPQHDAADAGRLCPDYAAAASLEQLEGSERYVVVVCAALGELDEQSADSWVKHHAANPDPTTNIRLQVLPNEKVEKLWNCMDDATYASIEAMAGREKDHVEYWHDATVKQKDANSFQDISMVEAGQGWKQEKPPVNMIRVPGIVHETSTLYMSDDLEADPHASVGSSYQPRGCKNVFVTGGALFPTSGSWNPTLTMCGFAQDLADKLYEKTRVEREREREGEQPVNY